MEAYNIRVGELGMNLQFGDELDDKDRSEQDKKYVNEYGRTFCASFAGSILDLTIFRATTWPVGWSRSRRSALKQMAKPPLPSWLDVA